MKFGILGFHRLVYRGEKNFQFFVASVRSPLLQLSTV